MIIRYWTIDIKLYYTMPGSFTRLIVGLTPSMEAIGVMNAQEANVRMKPATNC